MMRSLKVKRKDVVSGNIFNRDELIRICIDKNGATFIDKEFNIKGRGIYVHPDNLEIAFKKRILERQVRRFGGSLEKIKEQLLEVANG